MHVIASTFISLHTETLRLSSYLMCTHYGFIHKMFERWALFNAIHCYSLSLALLEFTERKINIYLMWCITISLVFAICFHFSFTNNQMWMVHLLCLLENFHFPIFHSTHIECNLFCSFLWILYGRLSTYKFAINCMESVFDKCKQQSWNAHKLQWKMEFHSSKTWKQIA